MDITELRYDTPDRAELRYDTPDREGDLKLWKFDQNFQDLIK